mgnify:CR=1 FL=1
MHEVNASIVKHEGGELPLANRGRTSAGSTGRARRLIDNALVQTTDRISVQFLRYLVVGGVATIFDFGVFLLLTDNHTAGVHYLLANALAFAVGVSVNYVLSVRWVFSSRAMESRITEFVVFVVVGIVGLGISETALFLGVEYVHLKHPLAKLGAIGSALVWNFAARKLLLFRGCRPRAAARSALFPSLKGDIDRGARNDDGYARIALAEVRESIS